MTFQDFYLEVESAALMYGYSETQVHYFKSNILECYHLGHSVEQTVAEVF